MTGVTGLALALTAAFSSAPFAFAQNIDVSTKCDPALRSRLSATRTGKSVSGRTEVIVRLTGDLTDQHKRAFEALNGDIYRHLPIIRSVALSVPTRHLSRLAALPFVAHLSADGMVRKTDEFTVEHTGAHTASATYGLTGLGVGVAVIDSGISKHRDLTTSWTRDEDDDDDFDYRSLIRVTFLGDGIRHDPCGHGTHVAGILGGSGLASSNWYNFRTFHGIARSAKLISLRVLDRQGCGNVSNVIAALNWAVTNKTRYNIRVINLSLGKPVTESYTTDPLCQAAEAAYRAGIVVVCAAGNGGRKNASVSSSDENEGWGTAYGSIQSPANDPYVITVGALKQDSVRPTNPWSNKIATYSARGPSAIDFTMKPDIVAPGNRIISVNAPDSFLFNTYWQTNGVPMDSYANNSYGTSPDYFTLSGTSMAAPVVAGAVALMLEKDPTLTPDTVKARLMISAHKWAFPNGKADPCTFGAGMLNIPGALASTVKATRPALSPPLQLSSDGRNVLVDPSQVIWGGGPGTKPPSNASIWGTDSVKGLQVIWGGGTSTGKFTVNGTPMDVTCLSNPLSLISSSVWSNQVIWGGADVKVDLNAISLFNENR
ncbi:MAG: S8 family serine peptidase [Capsulimonadales bacterium]|nr:S8 family serine peptidase [Capsulimonadales bacterium]